MKRNAEILGRSGIIENTGSLDDDREGGVEGNNWERKTKSENEREGRKRESQGHKNGGEMEYGMHVWRGK